MKWSIAVSVLTVPLFVAFVLQDEPDPGRGLFASLSAFSTSVVARYLWDLRAKYWFWASLASVIAVHTYLLFAIPWPHMRWGPRGLLPIWLVQIFLVRAVFWPVEWFMGLFEDERAEAAGETSMEPPPSS